MGEPSQPGHRRHVPGSAGHGRRQGRAPGDRPQGEAALRARPEEEKALLRKIADGTAEPGGERQIVKTKRFAIEPMFEEDAVAAMEDLDHDFYVFVNAETERICVLYRRRDGDFGLIEPVMGGEYTPERPVRLEGRSPPSARRAERARGGTSRPRGSRSGRRPGSGAGPRRPG